jgi:PEP-CTERM motif
MSFGQVDFSPVLNVAVEAIVNSAFGGSYDLSTAFPLTSGPLNPPTGATFFTSGGDLVFSDDSFSGDVSFQATGGLAAPEPSTWALMALGFAGIGLLAYRKRVPLATA